jgi:TRAP-type C4-dicarboxylate transport system substrate-binding protein
MKLPRLISLFSVMFFIGTCIISTQGFGQEKTITLRYSNFFPVSHKNSIVADQWCKEVEKRTNGRIQVRYYGGATLTSPLQTYDSVIQGVVDVGNCVMSYTMGKFPLTEVLDYPLGIPSGYVATKMMNAYYAKFKPKEFDDVKVLYFHGQAPGIIHTSKTPVYKLEDLKGLKFRTPGISADYMALLGGTPVAMPMNDAYDALSKGVTNGIMAAYETLQGYKLGEVLHYSTEDYQVAYTSTFFVVMNKAKWNSIPADLQKIIMQVSEEWIEKQGKLWDEINADGREYAKKRGIKIIQLSPEEGARWAAKAQPLFDKYLQKMKEKNLPGDQVLKWTRDFLKANPK